jgi:hypothetical protein
MRGSGFRVPSVNVTMLIFSKEANPRFAFKARKTPMRKGALYFSIAERHQITFAAGLPMPDIEEEILPVPYGQRI